jgi:hypothetical protein
MDLGGLAWVLLWPGGWGGFGLGFVVRPFLLLRPFLSLPPFLLLPFLLYCGLGLRGFVA